MEDVSAADVRSGAKDIQGMKWRTKTIGEKVRQRILQYHMRNCRENVPQSDKVRNTNLYFNYFLNGLEVVLKYGFGVILPLCMSTGAQNH